MINQKACDVPVLLTRSLRLRPLSMDDTPAVLAIHSDPPTLEYWGNELISELSEAEALIQTNIEGVESGSSICWAIERQSCEGLIGTCTLFHLNEQNRRAEVGYILKREHWGQGLMSEALSAMIDHAFESLQMHRLEADVDPDNSGSLALLHKFGFKHEGYFRDRWLMRGKWVDSDMLGLLISEYISGKG